MRGAFKAAAAVLAVAALALPVVPRVVAADPAPSPLRLSADDRVVAGLRTGELSVPDLGSGAHEVRVGVVEPTGAHRADVLFLHGHADRLDNHPALFEELRSRGIRVISFDLPSHGETDAGPIDVWSFADLTEVAGRALAAVDSADADRESSDVPLVLAGWSFGGLLATRIAQDPALAERLPRPLAGLALEVPALAPYPTAGGDGISRLRALTHDLRAPVAGPPSPPSPLQDPVFAGRLLLEAEIARSRPLPAGLPTSITLSDPDEDLYVDSAAVADWARDEARSAGADIDVAVCTGSRHGVDFEAYPNGPAARDRVADFVVAVATGRADDDTSTPTPTPTSTSTEKENPCR